MIGFNWLVNKEVDYEKSVEVLTQGHKNHSEFYDSGRRAFSSIRARELFSIKPKYFIVIDSEAEQYTVLKGEDFFT